MSERKPSKLAHKKQDAEVGYTRRMKKRKLMKGLRAGTKSKR